MLFMKRMKTHILICLSLIYSAYCAADQKPAEPSQLFYAKYSGSFDGYSANSTRELKSLIENGNVKYVFHSKAKNSFARIEDHSIFEQSAENYLPIEHFYRRKIFGFGSKQSLKFDWQGMQAHFTRKDKPEKNRSYPIHLGVLDSSLYQLKLQADLFNNREVLHYDFAKHGKLKSLDFIRSREGSYHLNGKDYDTVIVERYLHEDDKSTEVSLIPELLYQIAEIVHTEADGKRYIIELKSFEYSEPKLSSFYKLTAPASQ
jgi:hypothetical protein